MNTINLEEHNQIDDLRIERALSGLTPRQVEQLQGMLAAHEEDAETAEAYSEFDECVALLDLWLVERSPSKLDTDQRRQLIQRFAGGAPDYMSDRRLAKTPPAGRWFWMLAVSAAAACLVLGSLIWISRPADSLGNVMFSAAELRKQMLANPPDDMLRWKWVSVGEAPLLNGQPHDEFVGDVIWSNYRQQGFAFVNIVDRIEDPSVYQVLLYEDLANEMSEHGIVGCELRFDGYSSPFVVIIRPESKVSPQRFAVHRAVGEPESHAGPADSGEINLIAQADPLQESPEAAITSDSKIDAGAISNPEEQTTTF